MNKDYPYVIRLLIDERIVYESRFSTWEKTLEYFVDTCNLKMGTDYVLTKKKVKYNGK